MRIAVIYDTKTGTTATAAAYIAEGVQKTEGVEAACFSMPEADCDYVRNADALLIGSPTYMAAPTYRTMDWLQNTFPKLNAAGKMGGAFATEQYIHGGGENVLTAVLTAELVAGMQVYSGGKAYGPPIIHLGPVGMSQNIASFRDLFITYGERFAQRLKQNLR